MGVMLSIGGQETHQHLIENHLVEHLYAVRRTELLGEALGQCAAAVYELGDTVRPRERSAA
jgi:hypothetical protein